MPVDVSLRPVEPGDLPLFFEFESDTEASHMAAFGPAEPSNHDTFDERWKRILTDKTNLTRTIVADGKVVGSIARFFRDGEPEVTYWIGRQFWGQGIATTALRLLLSEVSDRPLYAAVAFDNLGSKRVLEKCGFKVTGRARGFADARGEEIDEILLRLD